MDVIYRLGEAGVSDIIDSLESPPSYNSVRVTLSILEKKGYLMHRQEGQRYVYLPTEVPEKAKRSVLEHVLSTFFENSASNVVSTLLGMSAIKLSKKELEELSEMIDTAKKKK